MRNKLILPLGITIGDVAGVGPELIVKLYAQGLPARAVVYGDLFSLRQAVTSLNVGLQVHEIDDISQFQNLTNTIEVIKCGQPNLAHNPVNLGQVSAHAGDIAYNSLIRAIDDAMAHKIHAIVTAPLHKVSLKMAGHDFPGHTEILGWHSKSPFVGMMLLNEMIRVLLVTIHIPLAQVPEQITLENEQRAIYLAHLACTQLGIAQPRVAVAGLNPHAGEDGRFGTEEQTVIIPAIKAMQQQGIQVSGPYPGDTIFMRARQGEFDVVVAQYHDQGLIPVKYLGIDNGVNVTIGLPFIRTSVDHGTAFDIAGQGIADPSSLLAAFNLAMLFSNAD